MRYIIMTLFLVCVQYSRGQSTESMLVNISQKEGLPSDEAYCVFKDSKGYIWIATDQGVVRHNGTKMEVIKGLPDNVVFKIREDSKGRVWFFSMRNFLSYYENGKVHSFVYNNVLQKYIGANVLVDAVISEDGNIYLSLLNATSLTINAGNGEIKQHQFILDSFKYTSIINVWYMDKHRLATQLFRANTRHFDSLIVNVIKEKNSFTSKLNFELHTNFMFYGSVLTRHGDILLFAGNLLVKLSSNGKANMMDFDREILTMQYNPMNDQVYIGLRSKGVAKVDINSFHIISDKKLEVLSNKSVTSVAFDEEGSEWFSTLENGVYYSKNDQPTLLAAGAVYRMYNYRDSILLFTNNSGVYQFNQNKILPFVDERTEDARDIIEDKYGNIFVACSRNKADYAYLYRRFRNPLPDRSQNSVYIVYMDSEIFPLDDTSYLVTMGGYLHKLIVKKGVLIDIRRASSISMPGRSKLFIDSFRQIWLQGYDSLYKYEMETDKLAGFRNNSDLFSKGISRIRQMSNGMLVVSVNSSGLVLLDRNKIVTQISEKDGLLSNSVRYILPAGNKLWLSMPNGISVIEFSSFAPLQYSIKNFSENLGLSNLIIRQLMEYKNHIVMATNKGIYQMEDANKILRQMPKQIPLYITKLNYYLGDTSGISSIVLPYRHNQLTVNFDAICYNSPSELAYYYRLGDGSDTSWHSIQNPEIVLANLTPGNYKLQIKAELAKYNRRSEIRELEIIIEKPWWQWNLVRSGALLLFLLIVYLIYNRRVKIITKREEEKTFLQTEMAELKQVALRSQMNPHFIFNCLTSIQQLVVAGNRDEANEYLVKFSRLIRKTLELSIRSHISLAEEKEYISEYLELEQLRIPGQFDFHFNIDKDINTDTTEIPNMMLQPIVENCVRHGIKHLENRKGKININVSRSDGYLYCVITDNGVGRQAKASGRIFSSSRSFGMGIIEKRLAGLAGYDRGNYFIKLVDLADDKGMSAGTKVILQLPFKVRTS